MSNNIDDLLNASVDELVDMKEFKPLPLGMYKGSFGWERTDTGVKFVMPILEVIELEDPEQAGEIEPDTKYTQNFMFYSKDKQTQETKPNEFGQGQLKKYVNEVLKPVFGGDTLIESLDAANGAEIVFNIKHRKDPKDADIIYAQIGKVFKLAD